MRAARRLIFLSQIRELLLLHNYEGVSQNMLCEKGARSATSANVSVVIPCYRCKGTIRRALDSVFAQTLRPAEVLLVDDASPDGTLDFLQSLVTEYPEDWVRVCALEKNAGPAAARNTAWEMASQPYIAFLDSDDSWHPQKIELQYGWMLENPEVTLTGQICETLSSESMPHQVYNASQAGFYQVTFPALLKSNRFSTPSVMIKKDVAFRFSTDKRFCEDYLLWCELLGSGARGYSFELPLTFCHKPIYGHAGLSSNMWAMEKGELDVYDHLFREGRIGSVRRCLLKGWSVMRYIRRVLKIKLGSSLG